MAKEIEVLSVKINSVESKTCISAQQSQSSFPYHGIFSPDGFLSTVPSDDVAERDSDLGKVGQDEDEDEGRQPFKKSKNDHHKNCSYDSDVSSSEAVFTLDHILEEIMRSLDTEDLLSCRLVCHRWLAFSIPALHKSIEITVENNLVVTSKSMKYGILFPINHSLDDFVELLRQNLEIFPYGFPCNRFIFNICNANGVSNPSFMYPSFQLFLDAYGPYIHKLDINGEDSQDEDSAVKIVRKLITEKTPNLYHLSLNLTMNEEDTSAVNQAETPILETNDKIELNTSLKVFTMVCRCSSKMVDMVLRTSLNLHELNLPRKDYKYFTQSVNLVHLLKKIDFIPCLTNIVDLESIARANSETPGNLKLREIAISYSDYFWREREVADLDFESEPRFVRAINGFLKTSWDSLETIWFAWNGPAFYEDLQWPTVMPNVKTVHFDFTHVSNEQSNNYCYRSVFPPNFSLAATFPKLEYVSFYFDKDADEAFLRFLNQLNPQKDAILSVKSAVATKTGCVEIPVETRKLLQQFFPRDPCICLHTGCINYCSASSLD